MTRETDKLIEEINALKTGQTGRRYRVGTFVHENNKTFAYLRYYNPSWDGCVEYDVLAASGAEAKKAAIEYRKSKLKSAQKEKGSK